MNCSKYLWPMVFASVIAGCSFTGGNAPITDGSATASVYTVKPGDTLYAISSRYGLDPAETLFIDDRAANIAAAEGLGIAGYLFDHRNPAAACDELRRRLL